MREKITSSLSIPSFSIITPTFNSSSMMKAFFESIKKQNYPKEKISIIIIDGGSSDTTLAIAKKYKATILKNPYRLAEPGVFLGMEESHTDLKMVLAADNIFKDENAFQQIAKVFENKNIYAAFPKHASEKNDNLFTKYHNNFTDPFNHFIYGNAANARTYHKIYRIIEDNDNYRIFDFNSHEIKPVLAFAQGFTIRGSYSRNKKYMYDDFMPVLELIKEKRQIAYLFSIPLYHKTTRDIAHFIKKQRWATQNALSQANYGISYRSKNLSTSQRLKIYIWPIYAFSAVLPIVRAVIGVVEDKKSIWLFHPVVCFLSAYASLTQIIYYNINKNMKVSRQ